MATFRQTHTPPEGGEMLLLEQSDSTDSLVGIMPPFGDHLHDTSSLPIQVTWPPQFGQHIGYELVLEPIEVVVELASAPIRY